MTTLKCAKASFKPKLKWFGRRHELSHIQANVGLRSYVIEITKAKNESDDISMA